MIKYQWEIFYTTLYHVFDAFENHQSIKEFTELTLNRYDYNFFFVLNINLSLQFFLCLSM